MRELKFRTTNPKNLTKKQLKNLYHNGFISLQNFTNLFNARVVKNAQNARRTQKYITQQYRTPIGTLNYGTEMNTYRTGENREMNTYKNYGPENEQI